MAPSVVPAVAVEGGGLGVTSDLTVGANRISIMTDTHNTHVHTDANTNVHMCTCTMYTDVYKLHVETNISTGGWKVAAESSSRAKSEMPSSSNVGTDESSCVDQSE